MSYIEDLFREKDYIDAYAEYINMLVERNPHKAVGGLWEEVGKLQFDFLVRRGLKPEHKMLDIGCGTLRGGMHFIRYLIAGKYHGMDISSKAIQYGVQLLIDEGLINKNPQLVISGRRDLKFKAFYGDKFDYFLAQSVFTHLKSEHIEECFRYIGDVMHDGSLFYFTFHFDKVYRQGGKVDKFFYPESFFDDLAQQYNFELCDYSEDYGHPRKQRMMELRRV